jgi:uncharacterized protein (DUF362 family)
MFLDLDQVARLLHKRLVAVVQSEKPFGYPSDAPFNPPEVYPEYMFRESGVDPGNHVYPAVRRALRLMGLDAMNFGSPAWNPIGNIVGTGATVIVKVNFVKHFHPDGDRAVVDHMLTHPAVIRPVIDYALRAVGMNGQVLIVDTPLQKADVARILELTQMDRVLDFYRIEGKPVRFIDMRDERLIMDPVTDQVAQTKKLPGDPNGSVVVRMDKESAFAELDGGDPVYHTLADHSYDHLDPYTNAKGLTNLHHNPERHEYRIGRTFLLADAIISVPKLKTHKKAGVTLNLKSAIGITVGKEYMPHHRPGSPPVGDAFPTPPPRQFLKSRRRRVTILEMKRIVNMVPGGKRVFGVIRWIIRGILKIRPQEWPQYIEHGDWYGNDTIWRTIVDLNKILLYCDNNGVLRSEPQRAYLSVIDGIIGHQGEGPMTGYGKDSGVIIGGFAPLTVDVVAARVMGFDPARIPQLRYSDKKYFLGYNCDDNIEITTGGSLANLPTLNFVPPKGWLGHVELS